MRNKEFLKKSALWVAINAALVCGQVNAQEIDGTNEDAESKSIEVISVTSTRTVKSIQDVPLAVTAVSGDMLRDAGITDVMALDSLVPGMTVGVSGNDARPAMRGARTEQVEAADVAVAFYSNGVYRPRHGQALAGFIDLERVEVLRGPQGTQFGRNAFGGAIDVIAKKPELGFNEAGVATTFGNYSLSRVEGFANLSLGDDTAVRFSGVRETRDPFVENTFNPDAGYKDADMYFLRGQVYTEFSADANLNLKIENWRDKSNGSGAFGYHILGVPVDSETGLSSLDGEIVPRIGRVTECSGGGVGCGIGLGRFGAGADERAQAASDDPFTQQFDFAGVRDIDDVSVTAEFNLALDTVNFKAIGAIMDYEELRLNDGDFSIYQSTVDGNQIASDVHSLELQLSSATNGPLEWVAGVYYFKEDLENMFINGTFGTITDNEPDLTQPRDFLYAPWLNQIRLDTTSIAAYASGTYSFTDTTRLVAGLRYTKDDREWDIFGQNPDNRTELDPSILEVEGAEDDWSKVTWKLGLEHDLSDDELLYAVVSTGFLAGNAQGAFRGDQAYDEQLVTAYELGYKSFMFDRTLRFNASLYYNDYEDLLSTRFEEVGETAVAFFGNAGEIQATGLELELDWIATDALTIGVRGAFNDAEYGDFVTPNVYQSGGETINGVDNLVQLDGLQVQLTPDYSFSFIVSYEWDLGDYGRVVSQNTLFLSDDYRTNDLPLSFGVQESYERVDLSLNWFSADEKWRARAYVNNATDEEILLRSVRFGGDMAVGDYANPRTIGVTLAYNF